MLIVQNVQLDAVLRHAIEFRRDADVGADGKAREVDAAAANRHGALSAIEAGEHAANQTDGDLAGIGTPHHRSSVALAAPEVPCNVTHLSKRGACKRDGDAGAVDGHGLPEDFDLLGLKTTQPLLNLSQL